MVYIVMAAKLGVGGLTMPRLRRPERLNRVLVPANDGVLVPANDGVLVLANDGVLVLANGGAS